MTTPLRALRLTSSLVLAAVVAGCGTGTQTPAPTAGTTRSSTTAPAPTRTGPPTPFPVPTATALGDRLVATISVAAAPCAMAVDGTSAWVTSSGAAELDRVDPATNAVADRIGLEGAPCGIAVGPDGRVWVAELGKGSVVAVDRATHKVTDRIDGIGPQLWDLKTGYESIWVVDRSTRSVLRIDPGTAKVIATIPVGPRPSGLAVVAAGVWVSDDTDGKVRRIDPATDAVVATVDVGGAPSWFADDAASMLLVAARGGGRVLVLDPQTGATRGEPSTGWNEPLDGAVLQGSAWIPEGSGRRVGVIDLGAPASEVVRYALPGAVNPFVAEPGFGDIWVLDFGGSVIWRIRP